MVRESYPVASVVMPVYNGGRYLSKAIESVLKQTYKNFELIIVNDGSTDESASCIQKYAKKDKRIVVITQPNQGIVGALNAGMKRARGQFVARMDADDICLPERFEKQVAILEADEEVVIVGCGLEFIDSDDKHLFDSPMLTGDAALRLELLLRGPFAHSAIMIRRAALPTPVYRQTYWPAEDYDLYRRLALRGRFASVGQTLLRYRDLETGISSQNNHRQQKMKRTIQRELWRDYRGLKITTDTKQAVDAYVGSDTLVAARAATNYLAILKGALKRGKLTLFGRLLTGALQSELIRSKALRVIRKEPTQ